MDFGWLKRLMPRGLYGRAALILFLPVVVITLVAAAGSFFIPGVLGGPAVTQGTLRGTALVLMVLAVPLLVAAATEVEDHADGGAGAGGLEGGGAGGPDEEEGAVGEREGGQGGEEGAHERGKVVSADGCGKRRRSTKSRKRVWHI